MAAAGSGLSSGVAGWAVIVAGAVVALVLVRSALATTPRGANPPADVMRRFGYVNLAQAVVVIGLIVTDSVPLIPPAICLIVGLHFVPLAPAFRQLL